MTRSYVVTALVGAAMVSLVAHAIVVGRLSHLTAAMLAFAGLFLAVKLIQSERNSMNVATYTNRFGHTVVLLYLEGRNHTFRFATREDAMALLIALRKRIR